VDAALDRVTSGASRGVDGAGRVGTPGGEASSAEGSDCSDDERGLPVR